jgi:threonine dehydrogenase-like Zn-dependent dehydrogenase
MKDASNVLLQVDEDVGLAAARRIAERLDGHATCDVCLDFSGTRAMAPGALGVIAEALTRHSGAVSVLGLSRTDERILEYLGVRLLSGRSEETD